MNTRLTWQPKTTPVELHAMLRELQQAYPIVEGAAGGVRISFVRSRRAGVCAVRRTGTTAQITFTAPAQAARAIGALLGGLRSVSERTPFTSLGIMLDCSRNAVIKVDHMKTWLRRLALLGYNMAMLYTEDTYELADEPYFGYQRGRYTTDELRELDACAARLGIELIPCIQTLGHLEKILRYPAYRTVRDTANVLMVGEPQTYALIEKMLVMWKSTCRTRRIHIGMDEAEELGRGRYLTLNGYRPGSQLMSAHLARVAALCRQHGLKPMIWSDMYFRLGSKTHEYYDKTAVIPADAVRRIPAELDLVYWDYYHQEKAFYTEWIKRHRAMGKEPVMASGIWTWNRYWYDHAQTVKTAGPCIDACRTARVREVIFTQWGDNGAYCDHDSAFAGMAWCAARAYGQQTPSAAPLEGVFGAVCGGSYAAHLLASTLHSAVEHFHPNMWEDPMFETQLRTFTADRPRSIARIARAFARLAARLQPHAGDMAAGSLAYALCTAQACAARYATLAALLAAYRGRDTRALRAAAARIPATRRAIAAMAAAFRAMWMRHNKPQGIEWIQYRFGMLDARYRELDVRLREYLTGRITCIAEWDERCPPA